MKNTQNTRTNLMDTFRKNVEKLTNAQYVI